MITVFKPIEKICLLILFSISVLPQFSFAQSDTVASSSGRKKHGMQAGYVVRRTTGDTVFGLVKKHSLPGKDVEYVSFKPKKGGKRIFYRADSIIAFGYGDLIYTYFDHCDWSRLILKGDILLYKGVISIDGYEQIESDLPSHTAARSPNGHDVPCYVFIKNKQIKFIDGRETKLLQTETKIGRVLKKETLNNFKVFIADDPEVLAEFLSVDFRFAHIPALIKKYNEHKKHI